MIPISRAAFGKRLRRKKKKIKMPTYRTQAQIESQLAWPIGFPSRAARDSKFNAPFRTEFPPDHSTTSSSMYTTSVTNVHPTDYEKPVSKVGLQILPMEKPSTALSVYGAAYPAPNTLATRLRSLSPEALEAAFVTLDVRGEGHVLLSELRQLLFHAFDASGLGEPEECVVATLRNLYEREGSKRGDGAVILPLLHIVEGVKACADMFEEEENLGRPEVLSQVGSLAVKEARGRDRTMSTEPSREGPPPPRLTPIAPLEHPHPTFSPVPSSTQASLGASLKWSESKSSPAGPEVTQRNAPMGETLSVDRGTGLLIQSPLASPESKSRFLTSGPSGTRTLASEKATGLNVGALRAASLVAEATLAGRLSTPPALSPSDRINSFRLSGPSLMTSGMRDFGDFGSNPRALPVSSPGIAGFYSTSNELTAGTTRVTMHPPFYTGHIPKDPHGSAAKFGLGVEQRNSFHRSTNLVDNFKSRVSGYTGYLPRDSKNQTFDVDKVRGVEADCKCCSEYPSSFLSL